MSDWAVEWKCARRTFIHSNSLICLRDCFQQTHFGIILLIGPPDKWNHFGWHKTTKIIHKAHIRWLFKWSFGHYSVWPLFDRLFASTVKFHIFGWFNRTNLIVEIKGITEYINWKLSWKKRKKKKKSNKKTKKKLSVHNVLENRSTWLIFHATNTKSKNFARAHTTILYFNVKVTSFIELVSNLHTRLNETAYIYVCVFFCSYLYVCGYRSCRSYAIMKFKVKKKGEANRKKSRTLSTVNSQIHTASTIFWRGQSRMFAKTKNSRSLVFNRNKFKKKKWSQTKIKRDQVHSSCVLCKMSPLKSD